MHLTGKRDWRQRKEGIGHYPWTRDQNHEPTVAENSCNEEIKRDF